MVKQEYYTLNMLRGLSALLVLFYHFFVFFFQHQETSAGLLQIIPVDLQDPFYLQALKDFPLNLGHFGVGFFFLISGFLIIPSLERYASLKAFVIHKIFRLWPSYAVCFASGLLFVSIFYAFHESPFPFEAGHILSYLFWIRDIFDYPFIDGAVWSLEIQVKFYLLAGLIWSLRKKNFLEIMCAFVIVASVVVYGLYTAINPEEVSWFYLIVLARKNLKFFTLILLGSCIYSAHKKQISWQKALILCGLLLSCFLSPLFNSPDIQKTAAYLTGLLIFSYFIFLHPQNLKSEGVSYKFVKWVSNISYPLYIGHVIPGYIMMYLMIDLGLSVYLGILMACAYVFVMAEIIHKKVETLFISKGSKIILFAPREVVPS